MNGKGIFIWRLNEYNLIDLIPLLQQGGFEHVTVKVAEANNVYFRNGVPTVAEADVKALQDANIDVYGYGFCYGHEATSEGTRGAERVRALGLNGYVLDVEGRFEQHRDPVDRARKLTKGFRTILPDTMLIFCSWPLFQNPKTGSGWHSAALAEEFMKQCDIAMPMCYWGYFGSAPDDAVNWLDWCISQYRKFTTKPIIPVGRAYVDSWETHVVLDKAAVSAFHDRVRAIELGGISWWELGWTSSKRPDIWQLIMGMPSWGTPEPEPDPDPEPTIEVRLTRQEREAILSLAEKL